MSLSQRERESQCLRVAPLPLGEGRGEGDLEERRVVTVYRRRKILDNCRAMRTDPTNAEDKLWRRLRNRQLAGAKFRRQHPVGQYIVDFYCHEANLAIELDGSGHEDADQADYDRNRSAELESAGITVIRFWNYEVWDDLEGVLTTIRGALTPALSQWERELLETGS